MAKFKPPEEKADYLQSLAKGLAVIEAFGTDYPEMTLSVVARRVWLKSRFDTPGAADAGAARLHGLQGSALSSVGADAAARLFVSVVAAGREPDAAEAGGTVREAEQVLLDRGARRTDTVCIARSTARRLERDYMGVGTRFPAHATSSGKVLFAEMTDEQVTALFGASATLPSLTPFTVTKLSVLLDDVRKARKNGWSHISQETALGLELISVPIRADGEARYALSVSAQVSFGSPTIAERYLPDAVATANSIASALAAKDLINSKLY